MLARARKSKSLASCDWIDADRSRRKRYVSIREHTSAYVRIRQRIHTCATGSMLTEAATSLRQHTSAYVSVYTPDRSRHKPSSRTCALAHAFAILAACNAIRQHTSAYVSVYPMRLSPCVRYARRLQRYTSAYVSIRQHTSAYTPCALAHAFAMLAACNGDTCRGSTVRCV